MKGGSGWLTRSLEQAHPYNLQYPGQIKPIEVKISFLQIIDAVENMKIAPENIMRYIIGGLVKRRDKITALELSRPVGLTIREIVERIEKHYQIAGRNSAKLPVLAAYVMLKFVVREMDRYKFCELLELEPHNAPDFRTGLIGDINVIYRDSTDIFESYEIKHNQEVTAQMLQTAAEKIYNRSIKRYYLITTMQYNETLDLRKKISEIEKSHNCELIVGNLSQILMHYLYLMSDIERFMHNYVDQIRYDEELTYEAKIAWNKIT